MKASIQQQLNNVATSIDNLIKASKAWKAELAKFKPIYDKATPDEQVEIRNFVATLIGKHYGVKPILLKTGLLGFERSSAESKALRRLFPVDRVSTSTSSKQVDPIVKRANKLKKDFTKAQLRKLVALLNV
jgi:hypothetical protein